MKIIINRESYKNNEKNENDLHFNNFKLIIEFSKLLSQLNDNEFKYFFDVYLNFQKNINNNALLTFLLFMQNKRN